MWSFWSDHLECGCFRHDHYPAYSVSPPAPSLSTNVTCTLLHGMAVCNGWEKGRLRNRCRDSQTQRSGSFTHMHMNMLMHKTNHRCDLVGSLDSRSGWSWQEKAVNIQFVSNGLIKLWPEWEEIIHSHNFNWRINTTCTSSRATFLPYICPYCITCDSLYPSFTLKITMSNMSVIVSPHTP